MQINKKVKNKTLTPLIKQQIVQNLMPLNPEKIILFGSYAYGKPNEDSDNENDIKTSSGIEKLTNLTVLTEFTVDGQICYCS